ncbi:transposase [Polaribacter septentrionalilitoris]|uniref:transposase n=1 Tax=Polaribacter septentrionalilitoris TaxID=2494657 RepID=UPI001F3628C7|nr:transposase [Polaribacter septentrionalilitoris]
MARLTDQIYKPKLFSNGDTRKQLLARSRYLLYKAPSNWTKNQYERSQIIFKEYPDIKTAFNLGQNLRNIFNPAKSIEIGYTKLAHWYNEVEQSGFRAFNTITINYRSILNYFVNRSTNASTESFNAKIKAIRSQFRGVKNVAFFLFRLTTIFA